MTGPKDAEPLLLPEVDGPAGAFHRAVLAEGHGLEPVLQAVSGHFPQLRVQARKAVLRGDPQVGPVQQEARDLAVCQPVFFRKDREAGLLGQEVVQPVQAIPVSSSPEDVSVRDQRHAGRHPVHQPGFQRLQVDGFQAVDAADP